MKRIFTCLILITNMTYGQVPEDTIDFNLDEVEQSLNYQTGTISFTEVDAKITVPAGFRFLGRDEAVYVLSDLWGNPRDSSMLGLLVPEDHGVMDAESWVFEISFQETGFVNDEDAAEIDYDALLVDLRNELAEENKLRINEGYTEAELIGWALKPYYDKDKKVLHWAKELKFGGDSVHTLNYNLRILGRKGVFVMNAIASIDQLTEVKANNDKILNSITFNDGSRYADFNPDIDEVAAWTIGGLVAGKVLAKAGFFAIILKFWKLIALGVVGGGSLLWKFISARNNNG